jgi:ElaB/YqjD/DUF883 family membrane-anchored ribosome-binding protein
MGVDGTGEPPARCPVETLPTFAKELTMADSQAARQKLMEDFSAVIDDSQQLLKAMASSGGDKANSLRGDLARKLAEARDRLDDLQGSAVERGRAAAKQADEYVRENPWESMAVGAGVAVLIGVAIGVLLARR